MKYGAEVLRDIRVMARNDPIAGGHVNAHIVKMPEKQREYALESDAEQ